MDNRRNKAYLHPSISGWLDSQIRKWVAAGIITGESERKIRDLYHWPPPSVAAGTASRSVSAIKILVTFGCLLIGTGVIFLISHNWPNISPLNKVLIILAGIALVHSLGIHLFRNESSRKFGHAVIFLGNILYGGGIWLVAQIFHINAHFPTGVFLWGLGILPFAMLLRSRLNLFFSLSLFALWTLLESIYYTSTHQWFVPFFFFILIPSIYYVRTRSGLVFTYLIGYAWLITNLYYISGEGFSQFTLGPMLLYGLALYSISIVHRYNDRLRYYEMAYHILGAFLVFIACAIYTLLVFIEPEGLAISIQTTPDYWVICAFLGAIVACGLFYCLGLRRQYRELAGDAIFISSLTVAFIVFMFSGRFEQTAFIYFLPLLLFCLSLYTIHGEGAILLGISLYFPLWLLFTLVGYNSVTPVFSMLLAYGACMYALSLTLDGGKKRWLAAGHRVLGLFIIFIVIYLYTIRYVTAELIEFEIRACPGFWIIFAAFYCWLILLTWRGVLAPVSAAGAGVLRLKGAIVFLMFCIPLLYLYCMISGVPVVPLTIGFNILLFFYIIAFLIISYQYGQTSTKALSITAFIVLVLTRYFDIGLNLVTRSVLFIIVGVAFIAGSIILEKHKHELRISEAHEK